jgi:hypothetical protein
MTVSVAWDGNGRQFTANNGSDSVTVVKYAGSGGSPSAAAADGSIEGSTAITVQVSKQGIALFVAVPSALNFSTTESGQLIYVWGNFLAASLLNTQAANGFGICLSSGTPTASNYSLFTYYGSDNYAGGWVRMILDPTKTRSGGAGTLNTSNITHIGVFADVGGTTARFDNLILDACDVGNGLIITGTSTLGLFNELLTNEATQRYGIVRSLNDSNSAVEIAGTLTLGDTSATASTITDEDSKIFAAEPIYYQGAEVNAVPNSFAAINVVGGSGTNSLSLGQPVSTTGGRNGISIVGNDSYTFGIDFSDGNVETGNWYGCSFENLTGSLTFDAASHNFKGNSISGCAGFTFVTGSEAVDCAFVNSAQITLSGTAALTSCVITESSAASAVTTTELENLSNCSFTKGATGHAVELTSIGDGSMNWDCSLSGYDTGSTGSPITPTSTGDEAIFVNVGSGTLTINVQDGASIPSIRSAGATVNVVAGQRTFTITVKDIDTDAALQNARVYVTAAAGGGLAEGTVIIDKVLTNASGQVSDTRSYSGNQPYVGNIRLASLGTYYKATSISGTISSSADTSINVSLIPDD